MDEFQMFSDGVYELWPRLKSTPQELRVIWSRISRHGMTAVGEALRKHKYDDPDAYKPSWKAIFALLSDSKASEVANKSALQTTIDCVTQILGRRPMRGRPAASEWSDRDLIELHIQIETQELWKDSRGHNHPDWERKSRSAAYREYNIRAGMVQDLEERGETVPLWLPCDPPPDMESLDELRKKDFGGIGSKA